MSFHQNEAIEYRLSMQLCRQRVPYRHVQLPLQPAGTWKYSVTVTEFVVLCSFVCLYDVQNFACQNHVRAVLRVGTQLFVCATGVDAPIVYYLDVSILN